MNTNKLYITLLSIFLASCATANKTYTADGREGFSINCSGAAGNWGMCEQKVGEICGSKGYDILSKDGENVGNMTTYNSNSNSKLDSRVIGNNYQSQYKSNSFANLFSTPIVNRTMLVACKK